MITFSPDHSAPLGLSVFSGFAIAVALVFFIAAALVYPAGARGGAIVLGALSILAGMVASAQPLRSEFTFFAVVLVWALSTGVVEAILGLRARRALRDAHVGADAASVRQRSDARDALTIGILGVLLAIGLAVVPVQYVLRYTVAEAHQTFTLTGITIGVGIFGAYAAIVAVYLAIAAFSPRKDAEPSPDPAADSAASDEHSGGAA
ncbi:hypothetical protein GCM10022240_03330 [Microbacterium kribbense]|uniref:Acyl-CoA synthetase n=2 Tax=Microbacterium kribbense TaxID=433645 RepID=A0ABP7G1D1_9MICO